MCPAGPKVKVLFLIFSCQLALLSALCFSLRAEEVITPGQDEISPQSASSNEERGYVLATAVYYAKHFNGKRTSSGARMNQRKLTAAHSTLPFGTRIKVTNLANNRSVVVTVNDRCRKRNFEFIDLSREAAHRLGFLGRGKARVKWRKIGGKY